VLLVSLLLPSVCHILSVSSSLLRWPIEMHGLAAGCYVELLEVLADSISPIDRMSSVGVVLHSSLH